MAKKESKKTRERGSSKDKYEIRKTKRKINGKNYTLEARSINLELAKENKKQLKKQGYKSCRIVKIPKTKQSETMRGSKQYFKYSVFCRK